MSKPKRKRTELGRALAKLRIDFDETGAEMAAKLSISPSQMFNVEVGIATVGYEFIATVKKNYALDLSEILKRGGSLSKVTIDLDELTPRDKATVLAIWGRANDVEISTPKTVAEAPAAPVSIPTSVAEVSTEDAEVAAAVECVENDESQWVETPVAEPKDLNPLTGRPRKTRGASKNASTEVGFLDEDDPNDKPPITDMSSGR